MYKKQKFFLAFLGLLLSFTVLAATPMLIMDTPNDFKLPNRYRITSQLPQGNFVKTGLDKLNMMGSAQFSEGTLKFVLAHYPKPSYVIDLRQESHGFVNGIAVSWYGRYNWENLNRTNDQILQIQTQLLNGLKGQKNVTINKIIAKENGEIALFSTITLQPSVVLSEQELTAKYQIGYRRIFVPDHVRPSDQEVNRFIHIVNTLPKGSWLYFHCKGGKGRTTTFMSMWDMMHNAKSVSFSDIIIRQKALGGINITHISKTYPTTTQKRLEFLQMFYNYCHENQDDFKTDWLTWLARKGSVIQAKPAPVSQ